MLHVATMRADSIMGLVGVAADPGVSPRKKKNGCFAPPAIFLNLSWLRTHISLRPL